MRDLYEIRQRVGYIAQQNVLPGDLTVMENMLFFAGVHSMTREAQKKRIPELLEFAGLSNFTDRLSGRLSGWLKKKLTLSSMLIPIPNMVVLVVPYSAVDP